MELLAQKPAVAVIVLALLWAFESWLPFFAEFNETKKRLPHAGRNFALGAFNALVLGGLFTGSMVWAAAWAAEQGFGLLHQFQLTLWEAGALSVVLFDGWMYLWHRINHIVPYLWRFHRVHHSDPRMDVTSGVRFHPGEIILSFLARIAVVPLLGLELWQLALYEALLLPVILFHHSNVAVPGRIDRLIRWVIVSPNMHRVHHSDFQPETDSNYASIFSIWDRLFRSYRWREDYHSIRFGLYEYRGARWHTLRGMLEIPFRRLK